MSSDRYFGFSSQSMRDGLGYLQGQGFVYVGQFESNKMEGLGQQEADEGKYVGDFSRGLKHGVGTEQTSLDRFVGEFRSGERHGIGERVCEDVKEWGRFEEGKLNGLGVVEYKGKLREKGWYRDGMKHGYCEEVTEKAKYKGQFDSDVKHGYGELVKKDFKYTGMFNEGKLDGFGIYEDSQCRYEGEFEANVRKGRGVYSEDIDGTKVKYVGSFEDDSKAGFGKLEDGKTVYIGGFDADQKTGLGFLQVDRNNSYFGFWENDLRHGLGILIVGPKEVRAEWQNDQLHGTCHTTIPGKPLLFQTYSRGKLQPGSPSQSPATFLAKFTTHVPNSFFQFSAKKITEVLNWHSTSLQKLHAIKFPPINLAQTERRLSEIKAIAQNQKTRSDKDRKELMLFIESKGGLTGPGRMWDIQEVLDKKKKQDAKKDPNLVKWQPPEPEGDSEGHDERARPGSRPPRDKKPVKVSIGSKYQPNRSPKKPGPKKPARHKGQIGLSEDEDSYGLNEGTPDKHSPSSRTDNKPSKTRQEKREEYDDDYQDYLQAKQDGRVPDFEDPNGLQKFEEQQKKKKQPPAPKPEKPSTPPPEPVQNPAQQQEQVADTKKREQAEHEETPQNTLSADEQMMKDIKDSLGKKTHVEDDPAQLNPSYNRAPTLQIADSITNPDKNKKKPPQQYMVKLDEDDEAVEADQPVDILPQPTPEIGPKDSSEPKSNTEDLKPEVSPADSPNPQDIKPTPPESHENPSPSTPEATIAPQPLAETSEEKPATQETKPDEPKPSSEPQAEESKPAEENKPAEEPKPSNEPPAEVNKPADETKPADEPKPVDIEEPKPSEPAGEDPAKKPEPVQQEQKPAEAPPKSESPEEQASKPVEVPQKQESAEKEAPKPAAEQPEPQKQEEPKDLVKNLFKESSQPKEPRMFSKPAAFEPYKLLHVQKVILDRVNKPSDRVVSLVTSQIEAGQPAPRQTEPAPASPSPTPAASQPVAEVPQPPPRKFSKPASFDPHELLLSKGLRKEAHPHSGAIYPTKQLSETAKPGFVDEGLSEEAELEVYRLFNNRLPA